jgi:N-acyl-D-aspartate/D-glutamate deacylase
MRELIRNDQNAAEILKSFKAMKGNDIVIARAPGFDYLVGQTVAEYASGQELSPDAALFTLMRQTKLRVVVFKKNINFDETIKALMTERAFVASNSPSLLEGRNVLENERAAKTFSKFLSLTKKSASTPLEWAIHKITGKPAALFNLKNRGIIKEGAIADIAILRDGQAVHVIVGGEVAVRDGRLQGTESGVVLRRS